MRVVVDANIVAAAGVRPGGWTARELARDDVEFVAPAIVRDELHAHEVEYAEKAQCGREEWAGRVARLLARIRLIPTHRLVGHAGDPLVRRIQALDPDDAAHVAAFLEANAEFLWTRGKSLTSVMGGKAVRVIP